MWQSIKKFFKRIADCTGISWIARKISSGWKWLFGGKKSEARVNNQNTPQQGESPDGKGQTVEPSKTLGNEQPIVAESSEQKTTDEEQDHSGQTHSNSADSRCGKPPVIGGINEDDSELVLFVQMNHTGKIFGGGLVGIAGNADLSYTEILDKLKYRVYIECEEGRIFKITCGKPIEANSKGAFLSIESIASQDGKDSSSELEGMKNMLGLSEKHAVVSITQISKDPITVPKTVEDGNIPSSTTNNLGAQSHTAGGHAM
ncbi:MAG: hypothetical protein LKM43_00265 [Wolbachia endosymbiont of Penenirmus auritus]|nr:hypothetical protein [Wolbachia endosymbiont of Penenirmus auritus]